MCGPQKAAKANFIRFDMTSILEIATFRPPRGDVRVRAPQYLRSERIMSLVN